MSLALLFLVVVTLSQIFKPEQFLVQTLGLSIRHSDVRWVVASTKQPSSLSSLFQKPSKMRVLTRRRAGRMKQQQKEQGQGHHPPVGKIALLMLILQSLGVIYGDVGTSPLYALRLAVGQTNGSRDSVIGATSAILWSMFLIGGLCYVVRRLMINRRGEGGTTSLLLMAKEALLPTFPQGTGIAKKIFMTPLVWGIIGVGLYGVSLLCGDGIITPAISVISAVEGAHLSLIGTLTLTTGILVLLFAIQPFGTSKIGTLFGPIMMIWFLTLGACGVYGITQYPQILQALSPVPAAQFVLANPLIGGALGFIVLAITGMEAMYADLGHFGASPIRIGFFCLVLPTLTLNYLGQGAHIIATGDVDNAFFSLAGPLSGPLVLVSTAATIIASQALITGVYSIVKALRDLGAVPKITLKNTNPHHAGQIYVASVNSILCAGTIALVWVFKSSDALASAYGIAVLGDMLVDCILTAVVTIVVKRIKPYWAIASELPFVLLIGRYLVANLSKVPEGGFVPLCIATVLVSYLLWQMIHYRRVEQIKKTLPLQMSSDVVPVSHLVFIEAPTAETMEQVRQQVNFAQAMARTSEKNHLVIAHLARKGTMTDEILFNTLDQHGITVAQSEIEVVEYTNGDMLAIAKQFMEGYANNFDGKIMVVLSERRLHKMRLPIPLGQPVGQTLSLAARKLGYDVLTIPYHIGNGLSNGYAHGLAYHEPKTAITFVDRPVHNGTVREMCAAQRIMRAFPGSRILTVHIDCRGDASPSSIRDFVSQAGIEAAEDNIVIVSCPSGDILQAAKALMEQVASQFGGNAIVVLSETWEGGQRATLTHPIGEAISEAARQQKHPVLVVPHRIHTGASYGKVLVASGAKPQD